MKIRFVSLFIVGVTFFTFATRAHAIVFLPAVILIPIANIVAWVMGGSLLPGLGIGLVWHKFFGKSLLGTLIGILLSLLLIGLSTALYLYWQNPDRPFF